MNTRFCLRPYDKVVSEKLEHAGILRPIARALSARGVKSSDDLLEDWTALLPPATLQGTQQAAVLLANAIQSNKRITVVADYDCDGATACAIAVRGLAMMGCQAQFIVPDRFKLGYGLTPPLWMRPLKRISPTSSSPSTTALQASKVCSSHGTWH